MFGPVVAVTLARTTDQGRRKMISPLPLVFPSVYLHIVTKYIRITEISIKICFSWLLLLLCSEATHLRSSEGCQGCRETDGATARCRRHLENQASNNFCSLKSQICIHPCSNIHRLCSATIELMQNMTNWANQISNFITAALVSSESVSSELVL